MLGTERDLQHFLCKVDPLVEIEIDRRLIHDLQPLQRVRNEGVGSSQIFLRFFREPGKLKLPICRIAPEIKKDAPAPAQLQIDEDIDDGGSAIHLSYIERPLVALEKEHGKHFFRIGEEVQKEFTFVFAVGICGNHLRQHLHVGAGDIPARVDGSQAELPFRQIFAGRAGLKSQTAGPELRNRIHVVEINAGRAAGRPDHIRAANEDKVAAGFVVKAEKAVDFLSV